MFEILTQNVATFAAATQNNLPILKNIVWILFGVFILNKCLGNLLLILGIQPRRLIGLPGIVCAPFLHANFNHLFFNLIPLLVLSDFLLINGLPYFLWVTMTITIISGALIWCFAKSGIHVGASALITGYWALLVTNIFTMGSLTAIILGVISVYYFAGIFFGIFPSEKGVSWEGHFFGLIAGIIVGYAPEKVAAILPL